MILRLLFNKYTLCAVVALFGDQYANRAYEEATFTEAEHTQTNKRKYTPTEEEQQTIENKKAQQKKFMYKAIAWYEGVKAYWFEAAAKKLKPLREKLTTIRQDSIKS
ncbi:MAG: hypothetical protein AAF900_02510 [Bacteroidota bacterium]